MGTRETIGAVLVATGALLLPIGYYLNTRLWWLSFFCLCIGAVLISSQRLMRREERTSDYRVSNALDDADYLERHYRAPRRQRTERFEDDGIGDADGD